MSEEQKKELYPVVVLASHGNKEALRTLYVKYCKSVFFIARCITGSVAGAIKTTPDIFSDMLDGLPRLGDYKLFEQWLYVLAAARASQSAEDVIISDGRIDELARSCGKAAQRGDKSSFSRAVLALHEGLIDRLPSEARRVLVYRYFAKLEPERAAPAEKCEEQTMREKYEALDKYFDAQCRRIKTLGVDISPFTENMSETLKKAASATFVPQSVHSQVSQRMKIDANPFSLTERDEKSEAAAPKIKKIELDEKKKKVLSKSDVILFFTVLFVSAVIISAISLYKSKQSDAVPATLSAQQSTNAPVLEWNGAAAGQFASGSGTRSDPYLISTGGELALLANLVNDGNSHYASCHYKLSNDILLNSPEGNETWSTQPPDKTWTPIGTADSPFKGVFDGADYTVTGMYVDSDSPGGLFGVTENSEIKNVKLIGSYVSSSTFAGGVIGECLVTSSSGADIRYCSFSGSVLSQTGAAGGIVGKCVSSSPDGLLLTVDCSSEGFVMAREGAAGGIAGEFNGESGTVRAKSCASSAQVSAQDGPAGGITGTCVSAGGSCALDTCVSTGGVSSLGETPNAGGAAGLITCTGEEGTVSLLNCYALEGTAQTIAQRGLGGDRLVITQSQLLSDENMRRAESFVEFNFSEEWTIEETGEYPYPFLIEF